MNLTAPDSEDEEFAEDSDKEIAVESNQRYVKTSVFKSKFPSPAQPAPLASPLPSVPSNHPEAGQIPCILHFDSLSVNRSGAIARQLRSYLKEEWRHQRELLTAQPEETPDWISPEEIAEQKRRLEELEGKHRGWFEPPMTAERDFTEFTMPHVEVLVPQQDNSWDCGYYLLLFAEKFAKEPFEDLRKHAVHRPHWFEKDAVEELRARMLSKMEELHEIFKAEKMENSRKNQAGGASSATDRKKPPILGKITSKPMAVRKMATTPK